MESELPQVAEHPDGAAQRLRRAGGEVWVGCSKKKAGRPSKMGMFGKSWVNNIGIP